jgi:hypothetical protein
LSEALVGERESKDFPGERGGVPAEFESDEFAMRMPFEKIGLALRGP